MASPAPRALEEEDKGLVGLRKRRGWLGCTGLFQFADGVDAVLMATGAAGAVANGMAQLLMTLIFGEVVNVFGSSSRNDILHRVSGVRLESPSLFFLSGTT
jgi:ATP-binding cassette subfamily B (MDR/TAP) protein 1